MARIYVTEPGTTGGVGAMGMRILVRSLRSQGHDVTRVRMYRKKEADQTSLFAGAGVVHEEVTDASRLPRPDAWFVSLLHVRQFWDLPDLFRRMGVGLRACDRKASDPLVAFGGAAMIQPEPVADFADVVALGDGEVTGDIIARECEKGWSRNDAMRGLIGARGIWIPLLDPSGILVRAESAIRDPYIPAEDTQRDTIELGRGCASKCAFCPIGWAGGTYREAPLEALGETLVRLRGKPVNFFAPDYSSLSYVDDLERQIDRVGCRSTGRDARLDAAWRHVKTGKGVKAYSFGVEGISARLREAIGKPLGAQKIVDMMRALQDGKVGISKWYMILGLPGETDADLEEFIDLLKEVRQVYRGALNITTTHLHAISHTPLQWCDARYSVPATLRKDRIFELVKGWYVRGEIPKQWLQLNWNGRELHESDAWLLRAGRKASEAIERVNSNAAKVSDGRWREGIDVDSELAELVPGAPLPWDHVDVGIDRRLVVRAWENYKRRAASS